MPTKNTLPDLRNHLFALMEALSEEDCTKETIERAKIAAQVAGQINSTAKIEIDAMRMYQSQGYKAIAKNTLLPAEKNL